MAADQRAPGKALELREKQIQHASQLIRRYERNFAAVVPRHVSIDAFIELALAYVKRSTDLLAYAQANPASLVLALRECAALGHMPMRGTFALVPFNDRHAPGGKTIVGVEEWRGVVERMFRAGGVTSVHVEVGRENDRVLAFNRIRDQLPRHEYDEFASAAERGPLKAVYAFARLIGGGVSDVAWLNRHDVERFRAMSKTAMAKDAGGGSFWGPPWPGEGPNTAAMWKKTALHRLEGLVPTSAEYRWQAAAAEAGARDWPLVPNASVSTVNSDLIEDAELVDDNPAADGAGWPATKQPPAPAEAVNHGG